MVKMKTTVIYHSADYDGIFCREIARKFMPDAEFIGWNFGDKKIPMPIDGYVFILDLSPECLDFPFSTGLGKERMIWIDHHKTSIDKFPCDISGYRVDGVAACRLTWQWFNEPHINGKLCALTKEDFINRKVDEPLAVRLAGEYDVWDHRGDGDLEFQYGLRTEEPDICWNDLLSEIPRHAEILVSQGKFVMKYAKNMDAMWLSESWHIIDWEGVKFLAQNSVQRGSGILDSKDKPETGHDALMLYGYRGKYWTVSLYHAKHRTDLDLSKIAVKHGGGGHRGACGFTCKELPFGLK